MIPYSNSPLVLIEAIAFALLRLGAGAPATATGATSRSLGSQGALKGAYAWEYLGIVGPMAAS